MNNEKDNDSLNYPTVFKAVYDMTDDELDEVCHTTEISNLPDFSKSGYKLYDANGNVELSDLEIKQMTIALEHKFCEVLDILRISRKDPNCTQTPLRIARMFINELLSGRYTPPPKPTAFPNRKNVDELIISKGIEVMSICSHHWQPISGKCAIGYIPDKYVIGLSKFTRIVDWFSRRAQIQEELGEQIADYLEDILKPKALGVVIKAKHYCMIARGVKGSEENSLMVTSVMRGLLLEEFNLRNEFLQLIAE